MNQRRKSKRQSGRKRAAHWPLVAVVAVVAVTASLAIWLSPPATTPDDADIVVYKTPTCSCCTNWVAHLRESGFDVAVVNVRNLQPVQSRVGVPRELGSCHTATVGDYWVEGHVPADLIQQLMTEKPDNLLGLAVPGMPIGSPGMEGPNPVEYDVLSVVQPGEIEVYATRQGQHTP